MKNAWTIGRSRGVPVRFHWSTLIFLVPSFMWYQVGWGGGIITFLSVVGLLLVHELGHALVAQRLGLEVCEIQIYFLHGRCMCESPELERHEMMVAWGGVLGQLAAFAVIWSLTYVIPFVGWRSPQIMDPIFFVFLGYNLLTIAMNLLPIPVLDGAVIWKRGLFMIDD